MYKIGTYNSADRMSDLICEDYPLLLVMSRFDIPLGFGDKTVEEVCRDYHVDTNTFLAVVNLLINDGNSAEGIDFNDISINSLLHYLKDSHSYFLDFRLPSIRRKLIEAIDYSDNDISLLIIRFYDEYVAEVRKHMRYEEEVVFPYVESLSVSGICSKYSIDVFSKQHDKVEVKLSELKNIIIKYYPARSSNELNSVLFDIFTCEADLKSHIQVEDNLFIPVIRNLEQLNDIR